MQGHQESLVKSLFFLILALLVFSPGQWMQEAHGGRWVDRPLWCKSPLVGLIGNSHFNTFQFQFIRNEKQAGRTAKEANRNLKPGSCAWADRPVTKNEPNKVYPGRHGYKKGDSDSVRRSKNINHTNAVMALSLGLLLPNNVISCMVHHMDDNRGVGKHYPLERDSFPICQIYPMP